ncbi:membrane protein [Siccirubricoccus deserti]|uniref:Mechanosensitive ion channel n=1 Tax=Siccirubricoccus deserti TaxID=2013562 RepID=A0A9X0QWG2_9PROT|nr:mechanosensitive ion channel domain-containing protein [Siccirubricoccus deserti]MBC4015226.1 mechanosensitive ion channel [Siccirubricoccus deserti]GGC38009.1 membrane protein [Siccirubricoccus deserti]
MLDDVDTAARQVIASLVWAPSWLVSLLVLGAAVLVALGIHRVVYRFITHLVSGRDLFWRSLVARTKGPTKLGFIFLCANAAVSIAPLTLRQTSVLRHLLLLCLISLLGWVAITALRIWTTVYLRRFKLDAEDNLLARKHATQSRILQRVASSLILVITAAVALMTFPGVRQYGVSLLASAGAAGLVVGLALQPVLKNLIAGIQLAVTQPIRIEDAVIVEGEWGNVEEINSTYVVVRLWDWRRMVLPLSYFIEHPFQNWTREGSSLIGTVFLYVDYTAPVGRMREQLEAIARASRLWDRQVVNMQVTDFKPDTMEIRMLVSAGNAGRAFDLRCEVREKMIAWLQAEHPTCLPRRRSEIVGLPEGAAWMAERPAEARQASAA